MAFGAFKAVNDVSVSIDAGRVLGLIGPNGAGKSTFFNCLTGDLAPTSGTIHFEGRDVTDMAPEQRAELGIARTFQVPLTFESMSVLDNVMIGAFLRYPGRPGQSARGGRLRWPGARRHGTGEEPRHTRPKAARDRQGARSRAEGAAAGRSHGGSDARRDPHGHRSRATHSCLRRHARHR